MDDLLVDLVVESYEEAPRQIVLDIDATDFEFHGDQEDRFFHGYYNEHCYLPVMMFVDRHPVLARDAHQRHHRFRQSPVAVNRNGWSGYLDPQCLEMGVDAFRYLPALRQVVLLFLPDFMETLHRLFGGVEHGCFRETGLACKAGQLIERVSRQSASFLRI